MKLKLDENLGSRLKSEFAEAGHHATTVAGQGLSGAADERVFAACKSETMVLVTLDTDFANLLRFPTADSAGVVVLRPPVGSTHAMLLDLCRDLILALKDRSVSGKLWIVEPGRIRERGSEPSSAR